MAGMVQQMTPGCAGMTAHAWSPDKSEIAMCPNNNELHIVDAKTWEVKHQLFEHDLVISGIDWSPVSNFIVTCSHDRNAFVWNYEEAEKAWKPSLVILRIDRAAIDVKWSPDGQKFAVASGAKCVPVCYYEADNNWWVSKMIKKHKSTVVSLAWHPNSQLLATGSSDFKCRVFSAFVSNTDAEQAIGQMAAPLPFGEHHCELGCMGWVNAVAWSPSGATLAFAGHDSSLSIALFDDGVGRVVQTIRFPQLPLNQLLFCSEAGLIGGGHDNNPLLFGAAAAGGWEFKGELDKKPATAAGGAVKNSAMAMWQAKDKTGESDGGKQVDGSWKLHQSAITYIQPLAAPGAETVSKFSATGLDGRLVQWDLTKGPVAVAAIGL